MRLLLHIAQMVLNSGFIGSPPSVLTYFKQWLGVEVYKCLYLTLFSCLYVEIGLYL